jgi:ubiquinone/menaquinone biosynthesis C-methylase UbiE
MVGSMKSEAVQKRYDWYSRFYDIFESPMEQMTFKHLQKEVIGSLRGNILEVGVGTGKNVPYYTTSSEVIGIDISPQMLRKAKEKLIIFRGKSIEFHQMNVQQLKFEENKFDTVVCTFVLCSVPDPIIAVKEMLRVLKPDGQLILLEHVLSKMPLLKVVLKIFNPFTRGIFGYNIDRDTITNLKQGNSLILKDQNLTKTDILKFLICQKPVSNFQD